MKLSHLGALLAAAAATMPCYASDDPAHPAYDYEQTVVYRTGKETSKGPASTENLQKTEADAAYPGAYFTPHVIYSDKQAAN